MDTLTERLERLAELQKKNIEPLQNLGSSAFVAFERMARKNYELMGDMVEYAVAQTRGSIEPSTPQALYERQMAEARAFAERMSARTAEYVALAEQLRDGPASNATAAPAAPRGTDAPTAKTKDTASGVSRVDDDAPVGRTRTESGKSGTAKADAREGSAAKSASGTPAARKPVAKKTAAAKAVTKKPAGKKAVAGKTAAAKAVAKKSTGKKATAGKTPVAKAAAKKSTGKKTSAGKTAAAKAVAKRSTGRKAAGKKAG